MTHKQTTVKILMHDLERDNIIRHSFHAFILLYIRSISFALYKAVYKFALCRWNLNFKWHIVFQFPNRSASAAASTWETCLQLTDFKFYRYICLSNLVVKVIYFLFKDLGFLKSFLLCRWKGRNYIMGIFTKMLTYKHIKWVSILNCTNSISTFFEGSIQRFIRWNF